MNKILYLLTTTLLLAAALTVRAGEIALTFDDAPGGDSYLSGMERTKMLVRKFDSIGVQQTAFFCVTDRLDQASGRTRLMMYSEAGHMIANHTHNHPDLNKVGAGRFFTEIVRADHELDLYPTQTGWFRYPYLHEGRTRQVRDSVRKFLVNNGFSNGYVTVNTFDWYLNKLFQTTVRQGREIDYDLLRDVYVDIIWSGILFYDSLAVRTLGRSPKHVLLLHENDLAALFIDALVERIRTEGWYVIGISEAYADPIADEIPDVLMNGQGRVAAIAAERGYKGPLRHESEDTAWLDAYLDSVGVFE